MKNNLCRECGKRALCSSLCPEAELYVNQDCVGQRELTIGLPKRGQLPNRLANIKPKPHLSSQQIERLIRKLRVYRRNLTKINPVGKDR